MLQCICWTVTQSLHETEQQCRLRLASSSPISDAKRTVLRGPKMLRFLRRPALKIASRLNDRGSAMSTHTVPTCRLPVVQKLSVENCEINVPVAAPFSSLRTCNLVRKGHRARRSCGHATLDLISESVIVEHGVGQPCSLTPFTLDPPGIPFTNEAQFPA